MGRCTEGGRRPTGERRRLKLFPQGVHSDASAGKLSWSESRLARVANRQTQPRERTMTIDRMTLKALIEKGSDDDLLREMMVYVANRMMDVSPEPPGRCTLRSPAERARRAWQRRGRRQSRPQSSAP